MLNSIDYQLSHDENRQQANETQLAPFMLKRNNENFAALSQFDELLAKRLELHHPVRFSPFVTHQKYINVMQVDLGRALYSVAPAEQVARQVSDFRARALCIGKVQDYPLIHPQKKSGALLEEIFPGIGQRYQPLQDALETSSLVILGCGLGHHLLPLAQCGSWHSILLVEPQLDLLKVSLLSGQWKAFLSYCQSHDIKLTILSDTQGFDYLPMIQRWLKEQNSSQFYLYRHYQHAVFNRMEMGLALGRLDWQKLTTLASLNIDEDRAYEFTFSLGHYLGAQVESTVFSSKLADNLQAFHHYLNDIADSFAEYEPVRWLLFRSGMNTFNLLDLEQGVTLFQDDGRAESLEYFSHYGSHPKLETLDARGGARKASPYLHYQYSDQLKELVQELPKEGFHQLPKKLPSFLVYGCGLGYHLEALVKNHDVDNLILYEPNNDYFYASLLLIDWREILSKLDQRGANLYLNIGDNGEHMVEDILNRLNYSGIHILSYTFFYISYYQRTFDQHIRHTREHFKILLNISEYYDHAFYNLTHTRASFADNCPYLLKERSFQFKKQIADIPVFLVGNGPSLDASVDMLREYQDRAIIISCGTSLKALYRYGIKPDFHAEVEQTRSTFHWICQVPDREWLKQIDLLTVNGVHPDVSSLFRQTLLCFKRGEAATLAHLLANPEAGVYQDILYSYPTVSNCAVSYALALGFRQLYLFGVDLGFKDPRYHHSQQSAYFKEQDGTEIYDYSRHGVGVRVPGNFDDYVFTKYEFKFSAEIITKTLAEYTDVDCYNTSDGAFIQGTAPLKLGHVLILNDPLDKNVFRQWLLDEVYDTKTDEIAKCLDDWLDDSLFAPYLDKLVELLEEPCKSWQDVLDQQAKQMAVLGQSVQNTHSLFFVLMRGSMNYCLTYLTRLAFSCEDESQCMERYAQGKKIWQDYLKAIDHHYLEHHGEFDETPGLKF